MTISQSIKIDNKLAVLDAVTGDFNFYGDGALITRINVPREHRGCGFGRELLTKACKVADRERVDLYLCVAACADSPMNDDDLRDWYMRAGFVDFGGVLRRVPK